ncbi:MULTISPECIES: SRPBCC domain-containing protein [unclassified Curtobacterium]|uniref:SRPBCC family protein n=1 Tax=unclassified Curtobacterium TaxID=257496 RepID=UPI0037F8EB56
MSTTIDASHDVDALTMTFTAEFDAPVDRVWQIWADPRQLERWWGPPTWPATFVRHSLEPGARSDYFMTGPDGSKAPGYWVITAVDPPRSLTIEDGFADASGEPDTSMPITTMVVTLEDLGGRTRMTNTAHFASAEQLEQLLEMGMREGMLLALGQIEALLAE